MCMSLSLYVYTFMHIYTHLDTVYRCAPTRIPCVHLYVTIMSMSTSTSRSISLALSLSLCMCIYIYIYTHLYLCLGMCLHPSMCNIYIYVYNTCTTM